MIDQLQRADVHDAAKRNVVRLLQFVEIPEKLAGKIFSICIDLIDEACEAVAIRVFAMSVAAKIADGERDLMNEIQIITEKHVPRSTAAFRALARQVFKKTKRF